MAPRARRASLYLFLGFLLSLTSVIHGQEPSEISLIGLFAQSGGFGAPDQFEWLSAARVAIENVNADPDILPNTILSMESVDTETNERLGVSAFMDQINSGTPKIGVIGPSSSRVCTAVSFVASWYSVPLVSYSCTSTSLSDKETHPYFLRGVPPDDYQGFAIADIINYFGFDDIAAISTADEYGARGMEAFRDAAEQKGLSLSRVEQFIPDEQDVSNQVKSLKDSGSRVFLSFMVGSDHHRVMKEAIKQKIIGELYVWFCADGCATADSFTDDDDEFSEEVYDAMVGSFGTTPAGGRGDLYEALLEQWEAKDPEEYPGAGKNYMHPFAAASYDVIWAYARAADQLIRNQTKAVVLNGDTMLAALKNTRFTGVTGFFEFDELGNRNPEYDFLNLQPPEERYKTVGLWNPEFLDIDDDEILWPGGTNEVPDLDVRPPISYWSCHDGKEYEDPTGKEVSLERADGDDVDLIDIDYHCDQFLDCQNMSDEGYDCSGSILPAMITFGIITGLLVLLFLLLAFIVIVLALLVKVERVVQSGVMYLLTLTFAAIFGLLALYSFYGRPTKVGCGFQPFLLGPPIMLLISTMYVRSVTQFITLRKQYGVMKFSALKFLFCIVLLNAPFFIILIVWYIVSTPTADYVDVPSEDLDHYICVSGGLVPGLTWVFFFLLVGYGAFIAVLSAIFVFVTRSVKTKYNEAQTIALSVYNLVFVGLVSVPILFILRLQNNILAYWILLNLVIIYIFSATLFFHYFPLFAGVLKDLLFPAEDDHDKNVKARPDLEG